MVDPAVALACSAGRRAGHDPRLIIGNNQDARLAIHAGKLKRLDFLTSEKVYIILISSNHICSSINCTAGAKQSANAGTNQDISDFHGSCLVVVFTV